MFPPVYWGPSFLIVADTANLIAGLREERIFSSGLSEPGRGHQSVTSLIVPSAAVCIISFSERRTMLALNPVQIFALKRRMRRYDAV